MKKIITIAFSLLCSSLFSAEIFPYPYNTLKEILPYHHHSQYQNEEMIRYLVIKHNVKVIIEVGSWMGAATIDFAEYNRNQ